MLAPSHHSEIGAANMDYDGDKTKKKPRGISQVVQRTVFWPLVIACLIVTVFVAVLHSTASSLAQSPDEALQKFHISYDRSGNPHVTADYRKSIVENEDTVSKKTAASAVQARAVEARRKLLPEEDSRTAKLADADTEKNKKVLNNNHKVERVTGLVSASDAVPSKTDFFANNAEIIDIDGDEQELRAKFDAKDTGNAIVLFYVRTCPFCQQIVEEIRKLAKIGQSSSSDPFSLLAVDCTENTSACDFFRISGFPSIFATVSGVVVAQYQERERTAEALQKFLKDSVAYFQKQLDFYKGIDVIEITSESHFRAEIAKRPESTVEFYNPSCSHCVNARDKVATLAKEYSILTVSSLRQENIPLFEKHSVNFVPYLMVMRRDGTVLRTADPKAVQTVDTLRGFISASDTAQARPTSLFPENSPVRLVTTRDQEQKIIQTTPRVLIVFHTIQCPFSVQQVPIVEELAREVGKGDAVIAINIHGEGDSKEIAGAANIQAVPTLVFYENTTVTKKMEGVQDLDTLRALFGLEAGGDGGAEDSTEPPSTEAPSAEVQGQGEGVLAPVSPDGTT